MEWVCRECGRTYVDPPTECAICGGDVVPAGAHDPGTDRFTISAARQRLLDPPAADTSLVDVDPRVRLAFRILVGIAILFLLVIVGVLVLG